MHMYVYVYCTCIHHHCHNRFMALFPGPPGWVGARRKLFLDFMVLGRITRCRHTNNPRGATPCGPISNPPPSIPCIFTLDAFLLQPSQFTLAWDRHRSTLDCIPRWLACTVRVSLLLTGLPAGHPMVFKLLRGQIVGFSPCRESVVAPIELEFGTDTTIGWLLPVMFYLISEEAWIREHHKIKIWSILWSLAPDDTPINVKFCTEEQTHVWLCHNQCLIDLCSGEHMGLQKCKFYTFLEYSYPIRVYPSSYSCEIFSVYGRYWFH